MCTLKKLECLLRSSLSVCLCIPTNKNIHECEDMSFFLPSKDKKGQWAKQIGTMKVFLL